MDYRYVCVTGMYVCMYVCMYVNIKYINIYIIDQYDVAISMLCIYVYINI